MKSSIEIVFSYFLQESIETLASVELLYSEE